MSKDPLGLFGGRWAKAKKYLKLKNNRILTLTILILIAGCFFYAQNCGLGVQASAKRNLDSLSEFTPYLLRGGNDIRSGNDMERSVEKQNVLSIDNNFCLNPQNKSPEVTEIEKELYAMVQEYPIKEMVPYIAEYDRKVAALIVGIAKKESNWGKRAPSKSGKTCYNYWGYKGAGSYGTSMGYGCFASPQEGVEIVGGRIKELVNKNLNTPSKMVVWKCGSNCRGHNPAGVQKWISDVNVYFEKLTT